MDRELEIKVLNINIEEMEEKLKAKGAEFLGVEIQKIKPLLPKTQKNFLMVI